MKILTLVCLSFLCVMPAHAGEGLPPRLAWTRQLHAPVDASPVIADGRLFVAAEDGNLHVFDVATGRLSWLYHCEGGIGATPAVADGRVVVFSRDGLVQALDVQDGRLLWRFATGGERRFGVVGGYGQDPALGAVPDPWDFWLSAPLIAGGRVVFGSSDGHVYALDAATGRIQWRYDAGISIHSAPAFADGRIFVGTWDTQLLALDAASGNLAWSFQGGTDPKTGILQGIVSAPRVRGDTVYAGARDGFLYAFDAATGAMRWRYDARGSWVVTTAAADEDTLYAATSDTAKFVALDRATGRERFAVNMRVWTYASPVLAGRVVFAAAMDGRLQALDARTGRRLWTWQSPEGRADADDIVDTEGHLRSGLLFAPRAQVQAGVERVKALGAFVATPAFDGRRLAAVTAVGQVVVFRWPGKG